MTKILFYQPFLQKESVIYLIGFVKMKYITILYTFSEWHIEGSWNPYFWEVRTSISSTVNIVAAAGGITEGVTSYAVQLVLKCVIEIFWFQHKMS